MTSQHIEATVGGELLRQEASSFTQKVILTRSPQKPPQKKCTNTLVLLGLPFESSDSQRAPALPQSDSEMSPSRSLQVSR